MHRGFIRLAEKEAVANHSASFRQSTSNPMDSTAGTYSVVRRCPLTFGKNRHLLIVNLPVKPLLTESPHGPQQTH